MTYKITGFEPASLFFEDISAIPRRPIMRKH